MVDLGFLGGDFLNPSPNFRQSRFLVLQWRIAINNKTPFIMNEGGFIINSGGSLLSHTVAHAVPSAQKSLTSVFGMGTGVTSSLLPPKYIYNMVTITYRECKL